VVKRGEPEWAVCSGMFGVALGPDRAVYNVLVRGDSARSTVKVTAQWTRRSADTPGGAEVCATTYRWESAFEADVKARAERVP
jgi:hypothetical protein